MILHFSAKNLPPREWPGCPSHGEQRSSTLPKATAPALEPLTTYGRRPVSDAYSSSTASMAACASSLASPSTQTTPPEHHSKFDSRTTYFSVDRLYDS